MKNKRVLIWTSICFAAAVVLISRSSFVAALFTPPTELSEEHFAQFHLAQALHTLPIDAQKEDAYNRHIHHLLNGVQAVTNDDGTLKSLTINSNTSADVQTAKGIAIGDSLQAVITQYGEHYYTRREQGADIIVYTDKQRFLEFWHWNDEVQEIRLGFM